MEPKTLDGFGILLLRRSRNRRPRSRAIDLRRRILAVDLRVQIAHRLFELANPLPDPATQFRQTLSAEDQEQKDHQEDELQRSNISKWHNVSVRLEPGSH